MRRTAGQAAPLDYNLDVLNGVSYTKGCYVGQERNSFTHYRCDARTAKSLLPKHCARSRTLRPVLAGSV